MSRKSTVDSHPKRNEILKAIGQGKSYRIIANRFGVSQAAVQRYVVGAGATAPGTSCPPVFRGGQVPPTPFALILGHRRRAAAACCVRERERT